MLQKLYKVILGMEGHEVVGEAYNGQECIDKLGEFENDPDYIIIDHRMPVKSGLEAMRELLEEKPDLKFIMISADGSIEEEAISAGAAGFIKKPFDLNTFSLFFKDL